MAMVLRNGRALKQDGTVDESDIHHPLLELRLTPDKGLGLFAKKHIKRGVRLLSETPLLVVVSKDGRISYLDLRQQLEKLSPAQLETLYGLQDNPKLLRPKLEAQIRDYAEFARKFFKDDDALDDFVDCQIKVKAMHAPLSTICCVPSEQLLTHAFLPQFRYQRNCSTQRAWLRNLPSVQPRQPLLHPKRLRTHLLNRSSQSAANLHQANYNPQLATHTVHAIRDIRANEEILTSSIDPAQASDEREEALAKLGISCECPVCLPSDAFPTSERRRQRIFDFKRYLYAFDGDHARAPGVLVYFVPRDIDEALDHAHEMINILLQEGLLGMELAQAYRWASKYSLQSGMLEKAKAFAQKEAEVEFYCLGEETGYMSEPSNAAEWMEEMQEVAEREKVKFKACEKRMMKEAKRLEKKAEKKAKKK